MPHQVAPELRPLARALLSSDAWFSDFLPEVVEAWTHQAPMLLFEDGEALCRRGSAVPALTVVVSGTLEVTQGSALGRRHVWSYLGAGQLMNLIPVLDNQPAIHDATAHGDTMVLQIPADSFRAAVGHCPEAMASLSRLLCQRSRALYEHAADSALLTLGGRCARTLLYLMETHGLPRAHGVAISLKVSQSALADMIGCTRQSINRELKLLERQGLIAMRYSHFAVLDGAGLQRLIDLDGANLAGF